MPWLPIAQCGIDAGSTRSSIPWASQRPRLPSGTIATAGETHNPFSTLLRSRGLVRQACLCKRWPAGTLLCHQRQQDGAQAVTESFSATLMCICPAAAAASRVRQRPLCPSSIAAASHEASIHATSAYASPAACSCACALHHLNSPSPGDRNTDLSRLHSNRCVI